MVDAFEIGINLALQDDVSAGLHVISAGLAEVDKAIALTSAKLANLAQASQAVGGAAVTGVSMRPVANANRPPLESTVPPEPTNQDQTRKQGPLVKTVSAPQTSVVAPREEMDLRVLKASAPSRFADPATRSNLTESTSMSRADGAIDPVPANTPSSLEVRHSVTAVAPVVPVDAIDRIPQPDDVRPNDQPAAVAPVGAQRHPQSHPIDPLPSHREEIAITSSLANVIARASVGTGAEPERPANSRSKRFSSEAVGRSNAPWTGAEDRMVAAQPAPIKQQAMAPQPQPQDRSEGMTGTVMLDGHLVGYWLSEQMAKEASRPPSGTSYFDPRQTPAWTASGSL